MEMIRLYVLLPLFVSTVKSCEQESVLTHMKIAVEMIEIARLQYLGATRNRTNFNQRPLDCADVLQMGHTKSGIYTVKPINRIKADKSVDVYCDMDTDGGGWTVIQRRGSSIKENDYFHRDWTSYKNGFGNMESDFWLGNDNIFAVTNQKQYSIRFDLYNVRSEKRFALYENFWIDDEFQNYMLHINGYSGDAGESLLSLHNEILFSTKDKDNDRNKDFHCAEYYKGGWWYNNCYDVNLNGKYLSGKQTTDSIGLHWKAWTGFRESLVATEMKIRPQTFTSVKNML